MAQPEPVPALKVEDHSTSLLVQQEHGESDSQEMEPQTASSAAEPLPEQPVRSKLDSPKELYKPDSTEPPSHQKMVPKSRQRLAEQMRDRSTLMKNTGELAIYKLPLTRDSRHHKSGSKMARYYIGEESRSSLHPEKVLMVLGATGAGKSTLINGMVNYLLGVRWEDDFRFKLIVEESKSQAVSQTTKITAYTLFHQDGFAVPYTLTIIDTPGFGDTKGLERDKEITSQVKEFFSLPPSEGGIDKLDGIGFVTQAALARLTPTQRYIFDSILATFGKDIEGNIFLMITFADGKKPPVVEGIKAGGIPYRKYFKFNNSAIYSETDKDDDEDEDEEGEFDHMFWSMGMRSFQNFFTAFQHVEAVSLQQTKEVLDRRHQIETTIQGLQHQITEGLSKIDELHQEKRILKEREADILTNKKFTYTVKVTKQKKVDLRSGSYVTNCLTCNQTCHPNCGIADDNEKYYCAAMDNRGYSDAHCAVCPGKCFWKQHVNNTYRFELYADTEERTSDELKQRYHKAVQGKSKVEGMISTIESYLSTVDTLVMGMIREVKDNLQCLDEIALKPNPLSEVEYIDLLIQSEQQEGKDGWNQRVQYLRGAKKQAQIQAGVKKLQVKPEQREAERKGLWESIKGWWNK